MKLNGERGPVGAAVSVRRFQRCPGSQGMKREAGPWSLKGSHSSFSAAPHPAGWEHGEVTFPGLGIVSLSDRESRLLEAPWGVEEAWAVWN